VSYYGETKKPAPDTFCTLHTSSGVQKTQVSSSVAAGISLIQLAEITSLTENQLVQRTKKQLLMEGLVNEKAQGSQNSFYACISSFDIWIKLLYIDR
jgi:hypothetical protein